MIILIDNYDSFTYNVKHYFNEIGAKVETFRNDQITIQEIIEINPKAKTSIIQNFIENNI